MQLCCNGKAVYEVSLVTVRLIVDAVNCEQVVKCYLLEIKVLEQC